MRDVNMGVAMRAAVSIALSSGEKGLFCSNVKHKLGISLTPKLLP